MSAKTEPTASPKDSTANLGFEDNLWLATDTARLDSAQSQLGEGTHVIRELPPKTSITDLGATATAYPAIL